MGNLRCWTLGGTESGSPAAMGVDKRRLVVMQCMSRNAQCEGRAILPLLVGLVADRSSVRTSLLVPAAAILYVFVLSLKNLQRC